MKILLITSLYPGYKNQGRNEVPYAIHYFVQEWIKNGDVVRVVRPWSIYPKIVRISKKAKKAQKYGFDECFSLDNICIDRYSIKKIPKIDYREKDIRNTYNKVKSIIENEFKPDIILCHMINPSLYIASLLKIEYDIPLFLTIHNGDITSLKKNSNMLKFKKTKHLVDRIGFRSEKLKNQYNSLFPNDRDDEEQSLIYSGINKNFIIEDSILKDKVYKKTSKILIAANFIPLKNIDVVIKAFSCIDNKELTLEIAGDGPQKEKLIELSRKLDLNDKVLFLGRLERERVLEKMRESDIFIMVSAPETFGLVYIEAMASGCIVIGSKGEGIDGVIIDGENGFLCKPKAVDELASTLNNVISLSSEDKVTILSNAVFTAKKMTQEGVSTKYLKMLEETITNYIYGRR